MSTMTPNEVKEYLDNNPEWMLHYLAKQTDASYSQVFALVNLMFKFGDINYSLLQNAGKYDNTKGTATNAESR